VPLPNLDRLLAQDHFPGMTFAETRITREWIRAHAGEWDVIHFNYRLGEGISLSQESDSELRRMFQLLTQKRADVVVESGNRVAVLEIKVRVSPPVIGQLLVYRDLWIERDPGRRVPRLIAVGRTLVPDTRPTLTAAGIEVELFPQTPEPQTAI